MTRLALTFLVAVFITPCFSSTATASDVPCEFRGKAFIRGYLQCLKRHDARYVEKGRGYTRLGNKYEFGDGVARNLRQAVMYYEMACDYADGNGCAYLARLYRRGRGVKKSKKIAAELLRRSYVLE